jgi:hypothetical protein
VGKTESGGPVTLAAITFPFPLLGGQLLFVCIWCHFPEYSGFWFGPNQNVTAFVMKGVMGMSRNI